MSFKLIKQNDHREKLSPLCGKIIEILGNGSHEAIGIAMPVDMKPTIGHFHKNFEEIYFVIDGSLTLLLYDPKTDHLSEHLLIAHELMIIPPEIHHKVRHASEKNRLCVIWLPGFDAADEHISNRLI